MMKSSAKYLNIIVPTLILACVALFYMDGVMTEEFQSGSCGPLLTTSTNTYSIYIFKQTIPPRLVFKAGTGPKAWSSTASNFTASGTNKLILSNLPSTKLIDYQVFGKSSSSWVAMNCPSTNPDFSIQNGNTIIYKASLASAVTSSAARVLTPPNPITLTGNSLTFTLNGAGSITSTDSSHNGANIRIDLNFL
jgi:hypothetical protein